MLLLRLSRNADPCVWFFSYSSYGVHRNHPVLTHSFPTRRSSDLLASITYFSVLDTRPVVHEILIGVFVTVTTPVTLILLARATRFRGLVEPPPPPPAVARDPQPCPQRAALPQPELRQRQLPAGGCPRPKHGAPAEPTPGPPTG